ncbi:MAG: YbjN domain-containing protein [Alcanivorax sp.]
MSQAVEIYEETSLPNPLDSVEDVLSDNNWIYSRMNNEELIVDVAGSVFSYRIFFIWQEHMNGLQIMCQYDKEVADNNMELAAESVMQLNRSLWMGHFEINAQKNAPCFRYTTILHDRKNKDHVYNNINDIVDICLAQCEQHQGVFQMLCATDTLDIRSLSLAMMETVGES